MDRRNFVAGSIALAGQHQLAHSMGALSLGGQVVRPGWPPQNLLSSTYSESFLASNLVSTTEWHPYPKWSERATWESVPADIVGACVEKAEDDQKTGWTAFLATTFMEFKRNGNRTHYQTDTFRRRAKVLHLVLAECMEGKGRFMDDIMNGVWLICEESFWGVPAHLSMQRAGIGLPDVTEPIIELFGAATAQLLAWTKYLLGPQLDKISPLIGKRITLETERRILKPARDRNDFWWMGLDDSKRPNRLPNWNPWINSNLLVANLILEEDPKLRVHEVSRIARSLDAYLNSYWPDAGEEEGPGYFSESPMAYFECVSMIEAATGNSANILANPFIDAMGRYILHAHIAGGDYTNFGDAHVHAAPDGALLYRFGKAVHDEQLQAFGAWCAARAGWTAMGEGLTKSLNNNMPSMSRALPDVLDANEIRHARREDVLLRDSWYPDLGLVTARVKAGSSEGMYFAVLAAYNGRVHNHNDTGSYIIYQDGQPVAIDVGAEAYTAKNAGPNRYKIWTMQSAYHNLPTIGGVMQHAGPQYRATNRKHESNDDRASYSFNIAAAYPKEAGVKSWARTVTLDRQQDKITVEENFELERAVPVSLTVMTPRIAAINPIGHITLKLSKGEAKPCLLRYSAVDFHPAVETIALTDNRLREDWGENIYRIRLNTRAPVVKGKWSYEFSRA